MTLSRRTALFALLGGAILSGCSFYREPPPVVIGGSAVAKDEPMMTALRASTEHGRFVEALEAAGLDAELEDIGPLTVFAPTDSAFDSLQSEPEIDGSPEIIEKILRGHIVPAGLTTEDLLGAFPKLNGKTKVFSLNKQVIEVQEDRDNLHLFDLRKRQINVTRADAIASNGIVHVVDGLLLPKRDADVPSP